MSPDGPFIVDRHPEHPQVAFFTGCSGHAFKFAPVLGELIASIALGETHRLAHKFRWRPQLTQTRRAGGEATAGTGTPQPPRGTTTEQQTDHVEKEDQQ